MQSLIIAPYPDDEKFAVYVDISDYLHIKYKALNCDNSENKLFAYPHSLNQVKQKNIALGNKYGIGTAKSFFTCRLLIN